MLASIVDVHSHPLFSELNDMLRHEAGDMPMPDWSAEQHLEMMDKNGIDVCMLSIPGLANGLAGPKADATTRSMNEKLAELVGRYPGRFGAFASVPLDRMDAAIEEMTYALDVLKLDGVCGSPHYQGAYLGDAVYDPWFAEMSRRSTTLFVHPGAPPHFDPAENKLNVSVLEFMFETTRMIATLVLSGARKKFDGVNIIATHGGGTAPYLAQRIALISQMPWAYRGAPRLSAEEVSAALGSFYFDLTASTSAAALGALRDLVPADRLLLGFDYPFMPPQTIAPVQKAFFAYPEFTEAERQKISRGNAERLFPRLRAKAPHAS